MKNEDTVAVFNKFFVLSIMVGVSKLTKKKCTTQMNLVFSKN